MLRGQTYFGVSSQRLFQTHPQPILIAACDQRHASGGAYRGVRISLQKADPACGNPVDIWRMKVGAPVAGNVSVAKVVGKDEDDIWSFGRRLRSFEAASHGQGNRAGGCATNQVASGNCVL